MNIVIRVDASTRIGTGHLMRCLSLAQSWQERGGAVHFVCAGIAPALEIRLQKEGMRLTCVDCEAGGENDMRTVALAQEIKADWVVLDGYHFGSACQNALKQAGLRLLCIDDYGHADHYYANLVLNQNISACESLYKNREPYTRLLLGPQFVLLRREFWPWRGWKRSIRKEARKILVTMGGSDPDNVTQKVVDALIAMNVPQLEVQIVVGPGNPHLSALESFLRSVSCHMRLRMDVVDMSVLMAWADVAVSAAGSTSWELAFMGLPCLAIITSQNQKAVAEELHLRGISKKLGWHTALTVDHLTSSLNDLILDYKYRQKMSTHGQALIDGNGSEKIVTTLSENNRWE